VTAPPPSGRQVELRLGEQALTVVEVGGGIREYTWGDRPVLEGYAASEICPAAHGQPLVPWPNRLGDGRYRFDGAEHQVALTEPEHGNAIHGLLRWTAWRVEVTEPDAAVLAATIPPQPGYPFLLEVRLEYRLESAGLRVTCTAANLGDTALPFGAGFHPYLAVGGGTVDGARLRLPGRSWVELDERGLPTGVTKPAAGELDFLGGRPIGSVHLDHCFGDLVREDGGLVRAELTGNDGRTATVWADGEWRYLQVFTGDTLPAGAARRALAVEPMTCPPDALRSGADVRRILPGERFQGAWGVSLR
jgi:aldose 1-epimerase